MLGGGYSHSGRIPPCHSLSANVCISVVSWPLLMFIVAMNHFDQEEENDHMCCCSKMVLIEKLLLC
jgi:hypothetical protein